MPEKQTANMIRNIVFDLGGVVLNWNPQKVKENFKGNPQLPAYLFESDFFRDYWTEFDRGTVSETEIIRQMAAFSGHSETECRELVEFIKHSLTDIPATVSLIRELAGRGYRLYCLSNMAVEYYDYLKEREVFRYFEGRIISGLVKAVKPEEEIYRMLLERYSLDPQETLFIDDLEKNIEAARQLGFRTVHFTDREQGYASIREMLEKDKQTE